MSGDTAKQRGAGDFTRSRRFANAPGEIDFQSHGKKPAHHGQADRTQAGAALVNGVTKQL